jgi:hypothetical protein
LLLLIFLPLQTSEKKTQFSSHQIFLLHNIIVAAAAAVFIELNGEREEEEEEVSKLGKKIDIFTAYT